MQREALGRRLESIGRSALVLHLGLSPLAFWSELTETFEFAKIMLLFATSTVLFAWILGCWSLGFGAPAASVGYRKWTDWIARDPVGAGVASWFFAAIVATVFSISSRVSFFGEQKSYSGLTTALAYVLLFVATRILCKTPAHAKRMLIAVVACAGVASAYALLQLAKLDPLAWNLPSNLRPMGTLAHANFLAGYLAMAFPWIAFFGRSAGQSRNWWGVTLCLAVGAISVLAVLVTQSRGGYLAFAAGVIVLAVGSWRWGRLRWGMIGAVVGGVLLAAACLAILWAWSDAWRGALKGVLERLTRFAEAPSRREIWSGSLKIFWNSPLFGNGLDTFRLSFPRVQTPELWRAEWYGAPIRADCELLHILATQGLVGLLGTVALTSGIVAASRRAWRQADGADRPLLIAIFAGMAAYVVSVMFSFSAVGCTTLFVTLAAILSRLADPVSARRSEADSSVAPRPHVAMVAVGMIAATMFCGNALTTEVAIDGPFLLGCAGIVALFAAADWTLGAGIGDESKKPDSESSRTENASPQRVRIGGLLAFCGVWSCVLVLFAAGIVPMWQASVACRAGVRSESADSRRAVELLQDAVQLEPWNARNWLHLGVAYTKLAGGDASPASLELLREARDVFSQAIALEPLRGSHHFMKAAALAALARRGAALAHQAFDEFDRALELEPANAVFYAEAGKAALALNDLRRARGYAEKGAALYPWYGPPRGQLGYIALSNGRYAEAVSDLQGAIPLEWHERTEEQIIARVSLATALVKSERFVEAVAAGKDALAGAPNSAAVHQNLAIALEKTGNKTEAEIHLARARALSGKSGSQ